jgi:hypothetical protein
MKEYDAETTWDNDASDKRVGTYLESVWHDPASPTATLLINSRPSEGTPTPLATAEQARIQANRLPDYRERSFKKVKLGRQPMTRFAYDAEGESYIAYFFELCNTNITARGSSDPGLFENFSEYYDLAVSAIKVLCDK